MVGKSYCSDNLGTKNCMATIKKHMPAYIKDLVSFKNEGDKIDREQLEKVKVAVSNLPSGAKVYFDQIKATGMQGEVELPKLTFELFKNTP